MRTRSEVHYCSHRLKLLQRIKGQRIKKGSPKRSFSEQVSQCSQPVTAESVLHEQHKVTASRGHEFQVGS